MAARYPSNIFHLSSPRGGNLGPSSSRPTRSLVKCGDRNKDFGSRWKRVGEMERGRAGGGEVHPGNHSPPPPPVLIASVEALPVVRKGIGIYGTATLIRVKPTLLDLFSVVK